MPENKSLLKGWYAYEEVLLTVNLSEVTARQFFIIDQCQQQLIHEEEALNNYLLMMECIKIERMRENIPHYSIMWLEA